MKNSVQTFLIIALIFLSSVYIISTIVHYENQIETLEQELKIQTDSLNCTIDSLMLEIDTLTWENEIWDFNIQNNTTHLLSALMFVESGNNDSAHAIGEDAVGVLQIRKTMVDAVENIISNANPKIKRVGFGYTEIHSNRHLDRDFYLDRMIEISNKSPTKYKKYIYKTVL